MTSQILYTTCSTSTGPKCTSCNPPKGCGLGWVCTNDWNSCLTSSYCCATILDSNTANANNVMPFSVCLTTTTSNASLYTLTSLTTASSVYINVNNLGVYSAYTAFNYYCPYLSANYIKIDYFLYALITSALIAQTYIF